MTDKIKSIFENAFMKCKSCGVVCSNDKEREEHICKVDSETGTGNPVSCLNGGCE